MKKFFICAGLAIVGAVMVLIYFCGVLPDCANRAANIAVDTYIETENNTEKDIRSKIYAAAYVYSEKNNHVQNIAAAEIKNIEMVKKLEVLRVRSEDFVFTGKSATDEVLPEQKFENDINVEGWFRVDGTGVFTVDLRQAEVLIDNERKQISLVLPTPEALIDSDVSAQFIHANKGTYAQGDSIAKQAAEVGGNYMSNKISTDSDAISNARDAAKKLLTTMIKNLNAEEIPDLTVQISFYDELNG